MKARVTRTLTMLLLAVMLVGCVKPGTAPTTSVVPHPNQISDFDGRAYDALLTAQAAVEYIRGLATAKPELKDQVNTLIGLYNATQGAYKTYHSQIGGGGPDGQQRRADALQVNLTELAAQISKLMTAFGGTLK